jgi:hypothetical protein
VSRRIEDGGKWKEEGKKCENCQGLSELGMRNAAGEALPSSLTGRDLELSCFNLKGDGPVFE